MLQQTCFPGITYHLENHHVVFQSALDSSDETVVSNAFRNMFDNYGQSFGAAMLADLVKLAVATHKAVNGEAAYSEAGIITAGDKPDSLACLTSMLRLAKFMVEEG